MKRSLNTFAYTHEWVCACVSAQNNRSALCHWLTDSFESLLCGTITIKKNGPLWSSNPFRQRLIRFIYCFFPRSSFTLFRASIVSLATLFRVRSTIEMQMFFVFFFGELFVYICWFCKMNRGSKVSNTRAREKERSNWRRKRRKIKLCSPTFGTKQKLDRSNTFFLAVFVVVAVWFD